MAPSRPNRQESNAVEARLAPLDSYHVVLITIYGQARQEMDLKVGCSFTRFLTRELLAGAKDQFGRKDLKVHMSIYGNNH